MTIVARFLLLSAFTLSLAVVASAATFVVNSTLDTHDVFPGNGVCVDSAGRCSLRGAIDEANALAGADTITLPAGAYTTTLLGLSPNNGSGAYRAFGTLTINGAGAGTTFIQGAISLAASTNSVMELNDATTNLTVNNVTFRYGFKETGAGIDALSGGTLTLNNCLVRDNQASSTTGGIGGGIYMGSGTLTLNGTTVTNNTCRTTHASFSCRGAGIALFDATFNLNNSTVSYNQIGESVGGVTGSGSGIFLGGHFTFNAINSLVTGNGAALTSSSHVAGVGIYAYTYSSAAVFNLTNTTISNNSVISGYGNQGGGIYLATGTGTLTSTIDKSTISGNQLNDANAYGGGMFLYAAIGAINQTVTNSTISGNYSGGYAGGIFLTNNGSNSTTGNGTLNYTNDTISGNGTLQDGGGIYFYKFNPLASAFVLNLNFVTVANNRANLDNAGTNGGGGIMAIGNTVNLKNSVIATNYLPGLPYGYDLRGAFYSQGYNQIGIADAFTLYNSTATDGFGEPTFGPLQNNSGPTFTQLPGFGPLVDQIPYGVNGCGTTPNSDQRGLGRPAYAKCDKGAVEWWYVN
jgi:CSLREA domain-containing protein